MARIKRLEREVENLETKQRIWSDLNDTLESKPLRAILLGRDRSYNRYWYFSEEPQRLYREMPGAESEAHDMHFFFGHQIAYLYDALDERGIRESDLRVNLLNHYFEDIKHILGPTAIDSWELSLAQIKEGWKVLGAPHVGRRVRRLFTDGTWSMGQLWPI